MTHDIDNRSGEFRSRTRRWMGAAVLLLAWSVMVSLAAPAVAQEQYTLEQQQWQKQEAAQPGTPEAELQAARTALAQGHAGRAKELATQFIERYPNHPALVEAYLVRGDARAADRDYYKALYDYEYVIRVYPATQEFMIALEREFEIAKLFSRGVKRKLWGMPIIDAGDEAEEIFIRTHERVPGSDLAEQAVLELADYYFRIGEMLNAAEAYDLFLLNYPRSKHREYAMQQIIQANLATFHGPRFDATGLVEAGKRLEGFEREYPASAEKFGAGAQIIRIDESLALKSLYTADWYRRRGDTVASNYMYGRVIRDYPQTAAARTAEQRLGDDAVNVLKDITAGQSERQIVVEPRTRMESPDGAESAPTPPAVESDSSLLEQEHLK